MIGIGTGMALSGAASAAGSIGGSLLSGSESKDAAKRQIKAALYMSNTAHQREVKDLIAAGLNPILSAGGKGASTPQPAMAQVPDYGSAFGSGMASAVQTMMAVQNLKSQGLDLKAKSGMYDWLKDNPQYENLFNAGLMAQTAGLPAHLYPLLLGVGSSSTFKRMLHDAANPDSKLPVGKEEAYHVPPQEGGLNLKQLFKNQR